MEEEETNKKEKSFLNRINYTAITTTGLGICIGLVLTFYFNDLSQFFNNKLGFGILALLLLIGLFLMFELIIAYLKNIGNKTLDVVTENIQETIRKPKEIPSLLKAIVLELKPMLSIWSLSRALGLIFLVIATILGGIIAIQQNTLINQQNDKIGIQNSLIESQRRSSLIFLMSNVLDKVDNEIKILKNRYRENSKVWDIPDSINYKLSDQLIGRISALSIALSPYQKLVDENLSKQEESPERTQLFNSLKNCKLDKYSMSKIIREGNFSNSNLNGIILERTNLFRATLQETNLNRSSFYRSNLKEANLIQANLEKAHLYGVNLIRANLYQANLEGANLTRANFKNAILNKATLANVNLKEVENLTYTQLLTTRILYGCVELDTEIKKRLKQDKPCLFTKGGCK